MPRYPDLGDFPQEAPGDTAILPEIMTRERSRSPRETLKHLQAPPEPRDPAGRQPRGSPGATHSPVTVTRLPAGPACCGGDGGGGGQRYRGP